MTMKIVAAAAGAMAFQALGGLFASPARAAWGWFMDVPTGLGFTCSEGTSLGCASPAGCEDSNFTCTVVPDAGMSCDVTSTNVVCSIEGGAQNFVPDSASPMCAQVNTSSHYNNASLSWSTVPTCGTTTSTTAGVSTSDASMKVVGFAAAALATAQHLPMTFSAENMGAKRPIGELGRHPRLSRGGDRQVKVDLIDEARCPGEVTIRHIRMLACACTAHVGVKAVWHQALKSLLFASRALPMTMKIVAAAAGAMAFQALGGLFASPARAAWGWFMDVPTGLGFTCSEGTSLGCASPAGCEDSNFTCTVVPDAGMSCDVTSTNVVCSIQGGAQNFVPDSASPMCAQVNTSDHYNNASLSWSTVPTCGTTTSTTAGVSTSDASMEVVGFAAAALATAQLL
ncbi:hypothetical protein AK812_SmicGene36024 [Symbiodinium microadriaticum]|uniref:Uncharacterized protein n=1 Tax=Symbiodinium microadriaticum TaxID=2951 RepID=A0A1Q9CJY3_SYMMI|nr:hypothetical protein AK812_SmicGene36024 [Symbiodinium microadriaticum]